MKIYNGNTKQKDMTAHPSKYPQRSFKEKSCRWCNNIFEPKAPSHLYCSQTCADDAHTDKYYRKRYGCGVVEVREMYEAQKGMCAICSSFGFKMLDTHVSGMNLDHCHTTGKVRGLLCHNCNRGLGLMKDDPNILETAARYVRRHQ